jgi:hypothetical protein
MRLRKGISIIGVLLEDCQFSVHATTLSVVAISRAKGPPKQYPGEFFDDEK